MSPHTASNAEHACQLMGGTNAAVSFQVSKEKKKQREGFGTRWKDDARNKRGGKRIAPRLGTQLSEQATTCLSCQERNPPPFRKRKKKERKEHYS